MMDEQRLDQLLDDAAHSYRTDALPPGDALWERIEAEAFSAPRMELAKPSTPWRLISAVMAASLVIGVAAGRWSAQSAPSGLTRETTPTVAMADPVQQYHQETEEFLGRTAVLLAALPADNGTSAPANAQLVSQAGQLLTTTRMMMDSPVGADQRMRQLLQDLELVLAQVARLQPQRQRTEMQFISNALEQRDLVPRLRSAVADLAAGDH